MLDLLKVIPGVVSFVNPQVSGPGGLGSFHINGTRGNQHELTIDGSSNVDTGSNGTLHVTINPDAVAEVKILTSNYQAEYGKAAGGYIQFVTKSGTNDFHGTLRYFRRHDSLNANNFFNNARGLPRQLYRYNYYGYDVSGPVYLPRFGEGGPALWSGKNKLFFFWNQEFYRQLVPNSARLIRVPTQAERNGDFSQTTDGNGQPIVVRDSLNCLGLGVGTPFPGNIIPRRCWFYNGQEILNIYPLPNIAGNPQYNFASQESHQYPRREDILRIDWNVTDRTRISGRFINNEDKQLLPYGTFASGLNFPLTRIVFPQPGINGVLSISHTFDSTLTNEFIFGPSRNRLTLAAEDDRATRARNGLRFPLLFPNVNADDYIPNFIYGGIANQSFPNTSFNGLPFRNVNNTFNFIDNLTKIVGDHTIKTGFFIQRSQKNQTSFGPINANINFSRDANNPLDAGHPFANALLGIYTTYQQANNFLTGFYRYTNAEFYVQDTWRMTPRLTLDYGLRVAWYQPQYDERRQTGVFNPFLFDRAKTVRLYVPVCLNNAAPCPSGANRRAVDPKLLAPGFVPTLQNTLPASFIGLIVPGSGDIANGIGRTSQGYPKGGYDSRGPQWGPRFGFAFDLFGDRKTVLRGGFGIFYDRLQGNLAFDMITAPPTILTPQLFYGLLTDLPSLAATGGALAPPNVFGYAKEGFIPTVYSYSLSIQREIGFNTVLDVAYVGTLSRHLSQQRNLNAIPYLALFQRAAQDPTRFPGGVVPEEEPNLPDVYRSAGFRFSGANALPINLLRQYPGYGDIAYREFVGSSNYHSLQVSVNRRFANRFTFGLAYTWSKAMDTANGDGEYTNPFNTRRYDYRLASFDRTHIFVANYVVDLPRFSRYLGDNALARFLLDNWQVSGISQLATGTPFELGVGIAGINANQRIIGSYTEPVRFNLRRRPQPGPNGLQIDPSAFITPPIGYLGPWSRNYLRNPGINNHDISIFKNFPFGQERTRYVQLRFEMFNAFNHTQFAGINAGTNLAVPNPSGGFITGGAIFNSYDQVVITNNLRPTGSTAPLGQFFGEYNSARDTRIIQLGLKVYF